jgi:hypothetical protein
MHLRRVVLVILAVSSCSPPAEDPCADVSCGANGHCASHEGAAECVCDSGFRADGLKCVAETTGGGSGATGGGSGVSGGGSAVTGGGNGTTGGGSTVTGGGSATTGGGTGTGACAADPCAALGRMCTESNGVALCTCPPGFADFGTGCTELDACAGNPCTQPNQNACLLATDGGAVCLCNPGFEAGSSGCQAVQAVCMATPHNFSGDDTFEPDECPQTSTLYASPMNHTLTASDVDWVHISSQPLQILRATISGSSTPLDFDVFESDSTTSLATDRTGLSNPSLLFSPGNALSYVRVRASVGTDTGPYVLSVSDAGIDDYANTAATAMNDTEVDGQIQYVGDIDVVKVPVIAGHKYAFYRQYSLNAVMQGDLFAADGVTLLRSSISTSPEIQYVHITADSTYSLAAHARMAGTSSGYYQFGFADYGVDDFGDIVAEASPLAPSSMPATGNFERQSDIDVFTFNVTAGHIYVVNCKNTSSSSSYNFCIFSVRDPSGTVVLSQTSTSGYPALSFTAATSGTYNLSFSEGGGFYGTYSYQLEDLAADDYSNTVGTPIPDGGISGRIELANDSDLFTFNATAGSAYQVNCTSTQTYNCQLIVRDGSGAQVLTDYAPVTLLAQTTGTYSVEVRTYNSSLFTYSLSVQQIAGDDYGDTLATSTPLTIGAPITGAINFRNDVDSFTASLLAGHVYQATCTGNSQACALSAYDDTGAIQATGNPSVLVRPLTAGTWRFTVAGYQANSTGNYQLVLVDQGTDDHANNAAGATALTLGTAINGNIQYSGDSDYFSFAAIAQHIYSVTCTPSGGSSVCQLAVRDSGGTLLGSVTGAGTTQVLVKPLSSGTVSVQVYASGTSLGTYSVTVSDQGADDFPDTVATATPITLGSGQSALVNYQGDRDVVSFNTLAGHVHRVTCSTSVSGLCDIVLRNQQNQTYAGTGSTRIFYTASAENWSADFGALGNVTGAYSFQVSDLGADDFPNTVAGATLFAPGGKSGNLEYSGDVDVVTFAVTSGQWYQFNATASPTGFSMTIANAGGTTVKTGTTSVGFVATSSGTFSLAVASSNSTGAWTVVQSSGSDDFPNTTSGAPTFASGATVNGQLEYAGDLDTLTFPVTAGRWYSFTVSAAPTGSSVVLRNGSGTTVSSGTGLVSFLATTNETCSVQISNTTALGSWTIQEVDGTDDAPNSATGAVALTLGVQRNGRIQFTNDEDWYSVTLVAGTPVTFTPTYTTSVMLWYVYNSDGSTQPTGMSSWFASNKSFTPTVSGTYYVRATSSGGSVGDYTMTVTQ